MLDTLKILVSQLNEIDVPEGFSSLKEHVAFFEEAVNAIKKEDKDKKQNPINFRNDLPHSILSKLCEQLEKIFQYLELNPDGRIALQFINALCKLRLPMDFPIYSSISKSESLADIVAMFCHHAKVSPSQPPLYLSECALTLERLVDIDVTASKRLEAASSDLSDTLCNLGYAQWDRRKNIRNTKKVNLIVGDCIRLLRGHAVHGLREDGVYRPALSWSQVKSILKYIDNSNCQLTEVSARCLFQVYCTIQEFREEFPQILLAKMNCFSDVFRSKTHGSTYEEALKAEFTGRTGAIVKLDKYSSYIDWKKCLDFNNPTTYFGLETDYLFTHEPTNTNVAIQVDGTKYHRFPSYGTVKPTNKRTLFRDFCFDQMRFFSLQLSDDKKNYAHEIINCLMQEAVHPVHHKLQVQRLERMQDKKAQLLDFKDKFSISLKKSLRAIIIELKNVEEVKNKITLTLEELKKAYSQAERLDASVQCLELHEMIEALNQVEQNVSKKERTLLKNQCELKKIKQQLPALNGSFEVMSALIEKYHASNPDLRSLIIKLKQQLKQLKGEIKISEESLIFASRRRDVAIRKNDEVDSRIKSIKNGFPIYNQLERIAGMKDEEISKLEIDQVTLFRCLGTTNRKFAKAKKEWNKDKTRIELLKEVYNLMQDPSTNPFKAVQAQISAEEKKRMNTAKVDEAYFNQEKENISLVVMSEKIKKDIALCETVLAQENPHQYLCTEFEECAKQTQEPLDYLMNQFTGISSVKKVNVTSSLNSFEADLIVKKDQLNEFEEEGKEVIELAKNLLLELSKMGIEEPTLEKDLNELIFSRITVPQIAKLKELLAHGEEILQKAKYAIEMPVPQSYLPGFDASIVGRVINDRTCNEEALLGNEIEHCRQILPGAD